MHNMLMDTAKTRICSKTPQIRSSLPRHTAPIILIISQICDSFALVFHLRLVTDFCYNTSPPSFLLRRGLVLLPSTSEPVVDSSPPRHLVVGQDFNRSIFLLTPWPWKPWRSYCSRAWEGGAPAGLAGQPAGSTARLSGGAGSRTAWGVPRRLAGRTAVGSGRRQRVLRMTAGGPRLEGSSSRPAAW